jgi:hypothetical protein
MSDRGKRSSPKIAYVLDEFPSLSELFILREMQGLRERHDLQLLPVALRRGQQEAAYSAAAREMLPDAVFRPARKWGLWLLPPLLLLRWPAGYASALGIVVRQGLRRPGLLRELGSALLAAGYFALRLPRSLRHVHGNWASQPWRSSWRRSAASVSLFPPTPGTCSPTRPTSWTSSSPRPSS